VSPNDLTSKDMPGRRLVLLRLCLVLFPAVTTSCRGPGNQCKFVLWVTTGNEKSAGTDDNIYFRTHENGYWHNLDIWYRDDFEPGNTDKFNFRDDCVDKEQRCKMAGIESVINVQTCDRRWWLLTNLYLRSSGGPKNDTWHCSWKMHKWFYCTQREILW